MVSLRAPSSCCCYYCIFLFLRLLQFSHVTQTFRRTGTYYAHTIPSLLCSYCITAAAQPPSRPCCSCSLQFMHTLWIHGFMDARTAGAASTVAACTVERIYATRPQQQGPLVKLLSLCLCWSLDHAQHSACMHAMMHFELSVWWRCILERKISVASKYVHTQAQAIIQINKNIYGEMLAVETSFEKNNQRSKFVLSECTCTIQSRARTPTYLFSVRWKRLDRKG